MIVYRDIDSLKLSQIYLSQKKMDRVLEWFDPSLINFEPVSVRDFLGNGELHITDGHTRTFVAWRHGVKRIPCIYDECDIVTCALGQIQYEEDIVWCNRFKLNHISALANRVLSEELYEELWRGRCGRMYDLKVALLERSIDADEFLAKKDRLERGGLHVYGISENHAIVYYENGAGELFEAPYASV